MPAWLIPALISGLGFAGGALNNRAQTQNQSGSQFNNVFSNQSVRPREDPRVTDLLNQIISKTTENVRDFDMSGIEASGISDINRLSNIRSQQEQELLAARGITSGAAPTAAAMATNADRLKGITQFRQSLPLLRNQLQGDILNRALNVHQAVPGGQDITSSQTTNTTQQGTVNTPGNVLGGGISNLAPLLAYFFGQGAFNRG